MWVVDNDHIIDSLLDIDAMKNLLTPLFQREESQFLSIIPIRLWSFQLGLRRVS
jgi:hypothetical protein